MHLLYSIIQGFSQKPVQAPFLILGTLTYQYRLQLHAMGMIESGLPIITRNG